MLLFNAHWLPNARLARNERDTTGALAHSRQQASALPRMRLFGVGGGDFPKRVDRPAVFACELRRFALLREGEEALSGASLAPDRNAVSSVTRTVLPSWRCSESAHAGQQNSLELPLSDATVLEWAWMGRWQA